MIKQFKDYLKESDSFKVDDIDAREDISKRLPGNSITVSTEIDPGHEAHPTISVYFPELFMYIDLEKIDIQNFGKLSQKTNDKIENIVLDLDNSLDYELRRCIENMQTKLIKAAEEIHKIPEVSGKRYGI